MSDNVRTWLAYTADLAMFIVALALCIGGTLALISSTIRAFAASL